MDIKGTWTGIGHFLSFLYTRFKQDRYHEMAASLTFTTLLSLVPLITIALSLSSAFPVLAGFAAQLKSFVLTNMPAETGAVLISTYMEQFAQSAAKLTAVGIIFLAFTAMLIMITIDDAFNKIWRVTRQRTLMMRLLTYWAVLTLAPLLFGGSLSLTSWLVAATTGNASEVSTFGIVMLRVVPALLITLGFTLLLRVVPNRYVPMRHALVGAVVAAVTLEYMNRTFAFYIANFTTYQVVYGTFASIPIFLLYIYLSWMTVLLGALIAASMSHWNGGSIAPLSPTAQFYYALRILKMMNDGLHNGSVMSLPVLSRQLRIGFDPLIEILEKLAQINIVRKLSQHGWSMIRDAQHIQARELFQLFVFDPGAIPAHDKASGIGAYIIDMDKHCYDNAISLAELFGHVDTAAGTASRPITEPN